MPATKRLPRNTAFKVLIPNELAPRGHLSAADRNSQLGKHCRRQRVVRSALFAALVPGQVERDPPDELTRPADVRARKNTQVVE